MKFAQSISGTKETFSVGLLKVDCKKCEKLKAEHIISIIDNALYIAKRQGKDQIVSFPQACIENHIKGKNKE